MAQQEKTPLKDEIPDEEFSLTGGAEEQGITISSDLNPRTHQHNYFKKSVRWR